MPTRRHAHLRLRALCIDILVALFWKWPGAGEKSSPIRCATASFSSKGHAPAPLFGARGARIFSRGLAGFFREARQSARGTASPVRPRRGTRHRLAGTRPARGLRHGPAAKNSEPRPPRLCRDERRRMQRRAPCGKPPCSRPANKWATWSSSLITTNGRPPVASNEIMNLPHCATSGRPSLGRVRSERQQFAEVLQAYSCSENSARPTAIIANIHQGQSVSFMGGRHNWHYRIPTGRGSRVRQKGTATGMRNAFAKKITDSPPKTTASCCSPATSATGCSTISRQFPTRFYNCGVAEAN